MQLHLRAQQSETAYYIESKSDLTCAGQSVTEYIICNLVYTKNKIFAEVLNFSLK